MLSYTVRELKSIPTFHPLMLSEANRREFMSTFTKRFQTLWGSLLWQAHHTPLHPHGLFWKLSNLSTSLFKCDNQRWTQYYRCGSLEQGTINFCDIWTLYYYQDLNLILFFAATLCHWFTLTFFLKNCHHIVTSFFYTSMNYDAFTTIKYLFA